MKLLVYAVLDRVVGTYGQPVYFHDPNMCFAADRAHEEAIRWFADITTKIPAGSLRTASDFALYYVGGFDTETGSLSGVVPVFLGTNIVEVANANS